MREYLQREHEAGRLADPGTYGNGSRGPGPMNGPDPCGIPTTPAGQWLLASALGDATLADIAAQGVQLGHMATPHGAVAARAVQALGNRLGAGGAAEDVRSRLRRWRDAGLLVHDGERWTATSHTGRAPVVEPSTVRVPEWLRARIPRSLRRSADVRRRGGRRGWSSRGRRRVCPRAADACGLRTRSRASVQPCGRTPHQGPTE